MNLLIQFLFVLKDSFENSPHVLYIHSQIQRALMICTLRGGTGNFIFVSRLKCLIHATLKRQNSLPSSVGSFLPCSSTIQNLSFTSSFAFIFHTLHLKALHTVGHYPLLFANHIYDIILAEKHPLEQSFLGFALIFV